MKESPNLDLLRSVAVGLVVLSHMRHYLGAGPWTDKFIATAGHMGVAIFFVHTALVLMMSLERHGPAAGPFFLRRLFRIYPLSIVIVLFVTLLLAITPLGVDLGKLASNLLLVQNLTGHDSGPAALWSLPYEVQMYLFLPALYVMTKTDRPMLRLGLVWVMAVSLAVLALAADIPALRFIPCFLPGVLAFVLMRRVEGRLSPFVLFAVVGAGVVAVPALAASGVPEIPMWWPFCLALGFTIPFCRQITGGRVARCAKVVATYSYGIYLTHVFAIELTFSGGGPWTGKLALFALLLPGFAYVAYHGIEKRGIRLGAWLADRLSAPRQPAAAAATNVSIGAP